jgi:DNA polymerase-4
VAKVASDAAKPDGVKLVPEGEEAAFLSPMPLRALPMLGPTMEKKLAQLGLTTLGQLASLPVATLEGLFGRHGGVIWQRSRGIDASPVGGEPRSRSISREGTFGSDVHDLEHLRAVLRAFSESVGSQLRQQGKRARTVSLKLRYEDFTTLSRSKTLPRPVSSNEAIFEAADALLTRIRQVERRPVRLIGVGASGLVEDVVQLSLEPSAETRGGVAQRGVRQGAPQVRHAQPADGTHGLRRRDTQRRRRVRPQHGVVVADRALTDATLNVNV